MDRDLKATWSQATLQFVFPILLIAVLRWLLIEPFVIPSGSMIPTLAVHDHIFVNKLAYGVRAPFSSNYLTRWSRPERGQVIVFKYPENPDVFYVKRLIAKGGDKVEVHEGIVFINGVAQAQEEVNIQKDEAEERFDYYKENGHLIRYANRDYSEYAAVTVPEGMLFVMGDNRDQSYDSRFWGFVPEDNVIGSASFVWLACEKTLATAQFLCDPSTLNIQRMFKGIR